MLCTNCGTQLNEHIKFCPECGTPVPQVIKEEEIKAENTAPPVCLQCGKQLKPEARFCVACGTKVQDAGTAEYRKTEDKPATENRPAAESVTETVPPVTENKAEAGDEIKEKTAGRKLKITTPSGSFEIADEIKESAFQGDYKISIYKNETTIADIDTKI